MCVTQLGPASDQALALLLSQRAKKGARRRAQVSGWVNARRRGVAAARNRETLLRALTRLPVGADVDDIAFLNLAGGPFGQAVPDFDLFGDREIGNAPATEFAQGVVTVA